MSESDLSSTLTVGLKRSMAYRQISELFKETASSQVPNNSSTGATLKSDKSQDKRHENFRLGLKKNVVPKQVHVRGASADNQYCFTTSRIVSIEIFPSGNPENELGSF